MPVWGDDDDRDPETRKEDGRRGRRGGGDE